MFTGESPIYQQLADRVAEDILAGVYAEESSVPSTNEYAVFYTISPITAAKGVNLLVDQGVLYKKRGVGMFVAAGALEQLRAKRRAEFVERHVGPLIREARLLQIDRRELDNMINEEEST